MINITARTIMVMHFRLGARLGVMMACAIGTLTLNPPVTHPLQGDAKLVRGYVIDTIRSDLPYVFIREPNMEIFDEDVRLSDPNAIRLFGKPAYQTFYKALRYTNRATGNRINLHAKFRFNNQDESLIARLNLSVNLGRQVLYVDVTSRYEFNERGYVKSHVIERADTAGDPSLTSLMSGVVHLYRKGILELDAPQHALDYNAVDIYGNVVAPTRINATKLRPTMSIVERAVAYFKSHTPSHCEYDFECPVACCDFIVYKCCCPGLRATSKFQLAFLPVYTDPTVGEGG